eukprot:COSAG05_NODE_939_length_6517_cov_2.480524_6_plen_107_part_00
MCTSQRGRPSGSRRYRTGEVVLGRSKRSPSLFASVLFSPPFADNSARPHVLVSPRTELGQQHRDVHTVAVHEAGAVGFNCTMVRADRLGEGWTSKVQLAYIAWYED